MTIKHKPQRCAVEIIAVAGILITLITGCTGSTSSHDATAATEAQTQQKAVQYTCSMHPEVTQDKPGNCPKCGMKLVEKR